MFRCEISGRGRRAARATKIDYRWDFIFLPIKKKLKKKKKFLGSHVYKTGTCASGRSAHGWRVEEESSFVHCGMHIFPVCGLDYLDNRERVTNTSVMFKQNFMTFWWFPEMYRT